MAVQTARKINRSSAFSSAESFLPHHSNQTTGECISYFDSEEVEDEPK